jgi:hypothetical protein
MVNLRERLADASMLIGSLFIALVAAAFSAAPIFI